MQVWVIAAGHTAPIVRQPGQAVADDHAYIGDAAVLDLGQDVQPVLGALSAVAGPQPEDVAVSFAGDRKGPVDRPVGDLAVADLHVHGVDEDHRIHHIQGPVLPFGHALDHLVGDR